MKEGYLLKRKTEHGVVSPQELEKINQYTRREFQAQELYAFSVGLCDNQVAREFECLTKAALEKLKELFLGKTGIICPERPKIRILLQSWIPASKRRSA